MTTVSDVWSDNAELVHEILEDCARLEAVFVDRSIDDIDSFEVSSRISQRLQMSFDEVADARRVRDHCALLDDTLSDADVARCRATLSRALGRLFAGKSLAATRAADEREWDETGRASRSMRHEFLVDYVRFFGDAREHNELPYRAQGFITRAQFAECRRCRNLIAWPSPPPFELQLIGAMDLLARIRAAEHRLVEREQQRADEQDELARRSEDLRERQTADSVERQQLLQLIANSLGGLVARRAPRALPSSVVLPSAPPGPPRSAQTPAGQEADAGPMSKLVGRSVLVLVAGAVFLTLYLLLWVPVLAPLYGWITDGVSPLVLAVVFIGVAGLISRLGKRR